MRDAQAARIKHLQAELAANKSDNPKALASAEIIALALAIDKFHWKPGATKQSATRNIVTAIEQHGMQLTDDTVRRRLCEAERHLPGDLKPKSD